MVKLALSASPSPGTSAYPVTWPLRNWFWADMVPLSCSTTYHGPRFCSKSWAPLNMRVISVTAETSQAERSPLKVFVLRNIWLMSVTLEVFHVEMSPLKEVAVWNMLAMLVTLDVSQVERSPLKREAAANMLLMSVTLEVSQVERSPRNAMALRNMELMSVTLEVSQVEMSPLRLRAPWNMELMLVTRDRLGASVASYIMLAAPEKAPPMEAQDVVPHCTMAESFWAFAEVVFSRLNRVMSPDIVTL